MTSINTPISKSLTLSDGRTISIETGKLAKLAHGSALVRMEDTMLLATVVAKHEAEENTDFLPLSVDYQERFAATGKIPGSFFRREGKLSDHEVLICRLVDRAIRPLFPSDYFLSTQINIYLISGSSSAPPDCLAALAASAALHLSDIPFSGPIAEVRVAKVDDLLCINPSYEALERATLDLIVAADKDNILMVEGEASEVSEEEILEAMQFAHKSIQTLCELQQELLQTKGELPSRSYDKVEEDTELYERLRSETYSAVLEVAAAQISSKIDRNKAFDKIKNAFLDKAENKEVSTSLLSKCFKKVQKEALRSHLLESGQRIDGRKATDIRSITSEVDYLPAAHGSALFTRGETQALVTATLGTKMDEQLIDGAIISGTKRFMLHYNFPGFSTSEVKPNRGPGRREVGHGNLAQRALKQAFPKGDISPYTIRIVSDILESNGSSSMATVCAGSLALMDAGIPISGTVAGIAMGLVSDPSAKKYVILSDILGDEDQLGDMDFKIAGTKKGVTACQMDIKLQGLSYEVLRSALKQAREGVLHIIDTMEQVMPSTRSDLKPHTPRTIRFSVARELIGAIIGPGGKVIQEIQRESGAQISIDDKGKQGEVSIFSPNEESLTRARDRIEQLTTLPSMGETYTGKVEAIMPYGAFVEFLPGKSGLLHISEIDWKRIDSMDGVLTEGEEIQVQLVNIDKKTGKYRLSRKVLLPKPV